MKRIFYIALLFLVSCSLQVFDNDESSRVDGDSGKADKNSIKITRKLKNYESKLGRGPSKIPQKLEDQMGEIDHIRELIDRQKYSDAFLHAKQLETALNRQIKARAAFLKGEILFQQNEYDLAMQLLEEMVEKYAFSGMVLVALRRLLVCAEKLKLKEKRKKYYSLLHDFFGAI
ncbi:MAG: hypothetical protein OXB84_09315 [Halobacteriovoraceae bacterium]|nr:hypothetical protein [Halobacteriovoraceae bacterium]